MPELIASWTQCSKHMLAGEVPLSNCPAVMIKYSVWLILIQDSVVRKYLEFFIAKLAAYLCPLLLKIKNSFI